MADPYEYSHPACRPPGNAPYDPTVGKPFMLPNCRWRIGWFAPKDAPEKRFRTGKELPKLGEVSDMDGTRVLDAGETHTGWDLDVTRYKDYFK